LVEGQVESTIEHIPMRQYYHDRHHAHPDQHP
jgi:hypothetical protein